MTEQRIENAEWLRRRRELRTAALAVLMPVVWGFVLLAIALDW